MYNKKIIIAATLAEMKLNLIPVYGSKDGVCTCHKGAQCTSAGKHPTQKDWQNNPVEIEELIAMLNQNPDLNIGVVTGDGLIVVDIDPKNGGLESFAKFEELFNPTFKVVTGSGGYHFYYLLPDGHDKSMGNKVNIIKGIDIRGENGFVVAPSSLHHSGNTYEIAEDSLDEIQVIGEELLELITKEKDYNTGQEARIETVGAFGEGERNARLTSVAGNLLRNGLNFDTTLKQLQSINKNVCNPPLSTKEVINIAKSVFKYNNHEKNQQEEYATVQEEIEDYLYHFKGNIHLRSKHISELIVKELIENGVFYKTVNQLFYFDNEYKKLFELTKASTDLKSLLARYLINASTKVYDYIFEDIIVYARRHAKFTKLVRYSYYDAKDNVVYMKNADGMYRITKNDVTFCDNGTYGILFSDEIEVESYTYIEDLDERDYITDYVSSLVQYNEDYLSVETQKTLVSTYFVALLMPELLATKPILVARGSSGSAKTTLLKGIIKCIYGSGHNVKPLPAKADDLDLAIGTSHFLAIDNLDDAKYDVNDRLAVASTGATFQKRRLYSDADMFKLALEAFIGITTRTLCFRREDVLQRLILLELMPIKTNFKSEADVFKTMIQNRDKILSQAIQSVQRILSLIESGKYSDLKTVFRMADFAKFLTLFLDNYAEAEEHLSRLMNLQRVTTVEDDVLIPYLAKYVEDCGDTSPFIPASELYRTLEGYSRLAATDTLLKSEFSQVYNSPIGFAIRLNNIKESISKYIVIDRRRASSNQSLYKLTKGERFNELIPKIIVETV